MLDKELIKTKIELIQKDLVHLEELKGLSIDEIAGDFYKWSTLKLVLVEIVGRAIDINAHIIAEKGEMKHPAPKTSRETFIRLGDMDILSVDFADLLSKSAGFRNRVVHEYNDLKKDKVYETVDEVLVQYTEYCRHILTFLGA